MAAHHAAAHGANPLRLEVHTLLGQISHDYERLQYNTVISGAMKLLNAIESGAASADDASLREAFSILLRALYPAAPHITHALWNELGLHATQGELIAAPWPQVDPAALVRSEIELVLQVNGKLRGSIRIAADASIAVIEALARAAPEVARFGEGRPVKLVKVVPGRLVNVVV